MMLYKVIRFDIINMNQKELGKYCSYLLLVVFKLHSNDSGERINRLHQQQQHQQHLRAVVIDQPCCQCGF